MIYARQRIRIELLMGRLLPLDKMTATEIQKRKSNEELIMEMLGYRSEYLNIAQMSIYTYHYNWYLLPHCTPLRGRIKAPTRTTYRIFPGNGHILYIPRKRIEIETFKTRSTSYKRRNTHSKCSKTDERLPVTTTATNLGLAPF